ncbi:helix-turn-helix domain-containing protein [Epidermidibacterium keratini]|uniref:Helix-turn-helix domain-containing protein n=1 Tax=Epidermidibacterium keratini TaxID=1891644 RepID=A0A7L4YKH0_9ACTN|nr:helix-turn-helix transcriptional regulator [Epidermidibacterium keratini]QHB99715.1 helix-turn-helix domain-containing protein [Epidermidibacterium keratini]
MSQTSHARRLPAQTRHTPKAATQSRTIDTGGGIDAHWHDEHQIVYPSQGVLSVTTDAGVWIAPQTRALWIPAGTIHEHRAYGPVRLHTVGLAVSHNPLDLHEPAVLSVDPLLRELIIAASGEHGDSETPPMHRLLSVMLDRLRLSRSGPLHLPRPRDERLVEIAALIEADPGRDLAAYSREVGASTRTVARLCRDELGMTFPQWRTQLRLGMALRLLADGLSVTSTAARCGWQTTSAFIDVFGRHLGYTPGRGE